MLRRRPQEISTWPANISIARFVISYGFAKSRFTEQAAVGAYEQLIRVGHRKVMHHARHGMGTWHGQLSMLEVVLSIVFTGHVIDFGAKEASKHPSPRNQRSGCRETEIETDLFLSLDV